MNRHHLRQPCVTVMLALLLVALLPQLAFASSSAPPSSPLLLAQDTDGDGITDDMDPDDDNDGKPDSDQGGDGTSPGNEPLPDSDKDGITDDMDPDDNNNAVTDENEPVPAPSGGNSSSPGSSSGSGSGGSGDQPLVRALPVTGYGVFDRTDSLLLPVVSALCALLTMTLAARNHRTSRS